MRKFFVRLPKEAMQSLAKLGDTRQRMYWQNSV